MVSPFTSFATGFFEGANDAAASEAKQRQRMQELMWRSAMNQFDENVKKWNDNYTKAEAEANRGNTIKQSLTKVNGIHPAIIDHYYDIYGNDIAKPEMIELMRASKVDLQGGITPLNVPKRMSQSGGQVVAPLSQLVGQRHGLKPEDFAKLRAQYGDRELPTAERLSQSNYAVTMPPDPRISAMIKEAFTTVLSHADNLALNNGVGDVAGAPKRAEAMFTQLLLARGVPPQAIPQMDWSVFGVLDPVLIRQMAQRSYEEQQEQRKQQALAQAGVSPTQQKLIEGGVPPSTAFNTEVGEGGAFIPQNADPTAVHNQIMRGATILYPEDIIRDAMGEIKIVSLDPAKRLEISQVVARAQNIYSESLRNVGRVKGAKAQAVGPQEALNQAYGEYQKAVTQANKTAMEDVNKQADDEAKAIAAYEQELGQLRSQGINDPNQAVSAALARLSPTNRQIIQRIRARAIQQRMQQQQEQTQPGQPPLSP